MPRRGRVEGRSGKRSRLGRGGFLRLRRGCRSVRNELVGLGPAPRTPKGAEDPAQYDADQEGNENQQSPGDVETPHQKLHLYLLRVLQGEGHKEGQDEHYYQKPEGHGIVPRRQQRFSDKLMRRDAVVNAELAAGPRLEEPREGMRRMPGHRASGHDGEAGS